MRTLRSALATEHVVGELIETPWPSVNDLLHLHTKELVVVGAAPGGGKSVFALNLAAHQEGGVLYLAQDSAPSVLSRAAALHTNMTIDRAQEYLRDPGWKEELLDMVDGAYPNIYFQARTQTLEEIEARLVALTEVDGEAPKLVVIDNLNDLTVPGYVHTELGFYAASLNPLKQMAIKHNTCIMALHHVTRSDGHGTGQQRLTMTDMMFTGEREAEHVLGIYYNSEKTKMYLQILKQRDGEADSNGNLRLTLSWQADKGRLRRW